MKAITILIISVLYYGNFAQAQVKKSYVDSMVDAMNITGIHDPDLLCDTLLQPFKTDSEKVRAIYYWVTKNIGYDCKEFHAIQPFFKTQEDADNYYDKTVERTLAKRKGVCGDYAKVFAYLCNYAKIKCEVVEGYALLGEPNVLLKLQGNDAVNHDWNAVLINNKWYLVDATWGSGYCDVGVTKFTRSPNDIYYLSSPDTFILNHHPEDPRWQLLDNPMNMNEWINYLQNREKLITQVADSVKR